MIALDTNVLVRYILQDDPQQAQLATQLIEERCSIKNPALISHVVLCELVWVLRHTYGYPRDLVAAVLKQILSTDRLEVPARGVVWKAIYDYEENPGDFADYLIANSNKTLGAKTTFTFDQKAAKHPQFSLLSDPVK